MKSLEVASLLLLAAFITFKLGQANTKNLSDDEVLLRKISRLDDDVLREKFTYFLQNYPFIRSEQGNFTAPNGTVIVGFGISFIDRSIAKLLGLVTTDKRRRASNRAQIIKNDHHQHHLDYQCNCGCETVCNIPKCPKIRNGFLKCKYPNCGDRCDLMLEFGDFEYTLVPENRTVIPMEFVTTTTKRPQRTTRGYVLRMGLPDVPVRKNVANRILIGKINKTLESPYQGVGHLLTKIKQMTPDEALQTDILALLQPDTEQLERFDEHLVGDLRQVLKHFEDKMPPHLPKPGHNSDKKWIRRVKKHLGSIVTASYAVFGHILAETERNRLREKRGLMDIKKKEGGGPQPCVCDIKCEVSAEHCMLRCPTEPRCPPAKCVCTS